MRGIKPLLLAALAVVTAVAAVADSPAEPRPFPAPCTMRVESELFAGGDEPVARSLTLFHEGVAWDFLELPAADASGDQAMKLTDIVLHDPAR